MPLNRFLNNIVKWTEPQISADENELRYWQDRVAFSFLLFCIFFGFFVLIFSVLLSLKEGLWLIAVIDIVIYLWVFILFSKRSISYVFRNISIVTLCYLLGVTLLIAIGPFGGAGPVWLFFFPIITGLLANVRYAIVSLFINIITLVAIGLSVHFGWYEWTFTPQYPMEKWMVLGLNFILLNGASTIAVTLIIRSLRLSLQEKKLALNTLEDKNIQLQDFNEQLLLEMNERKKAQNSLIKSEEALKESEIKYKELVSLLPIAYLYIDKQNILRFVNEKAYELINISDSVIGCKIVWNTLKLLNVEDLEHFEAAIDRTLQGKDNCWGSYTIQSTDGRKTPVETYISTVTEDDTIAGYQVLIVDISDRQEKEKLKREKEVAEKANIAISEWVDFIAHELKTPTTSISGFAEIGIHQINKLKIVDKLTHISESISDLEQNIEIPELDFVEDFSLLEKDLKTIGKKLIDYLKTIKTSATRLTKLVNDLLDYSKLQANSMAFYKESTSILAIIEEAQVEMDSLLQEKNLKIEISYTDNPIRLVCDTFRIGQIFRNLLSNAVKFSSPGKQIKVNIKQAEKVPDPYIFNLSQPAMQITICDEGIGIPQDQLQSIFKKFKQSRKTRIGEGTGLGLPICREIAKAHNGIIWAESQEEQGTQIHLILPYS